MGHWGPDLPPRIFDKEKAVTIFWCDALGDLLWQVWSSTVGMDLLKNICIVAERAEIPVVGRAPTYYTNEVGKFEDLAIADVHFNSWMSDHGIEIEYNERSSLRYAGVEPRTIVRAMDQIRASEKSMHWIRYLVVRGSERARWSIRSLKCSKPSLREKYLTLSDILLMQIWREFLEEEGWKTCQSLRKIQVGPKISTDMTKQHCNAEQDASGLLSPMHSCTRN